MLASLRPAIRATRVEPIAAVREGATLPEGRLAKYRTVGSAATVALGVIALLLGLFVASGTAAILILMGLGAVLIFIGVALLSARIVPTLATWLGWPATKIAGATGRLARDNARRNPQRTASTASALMIGLALVTFVSVLGAGIIADFKNSVDRDLHRRLRDHRPEQLLADPDRAGAGSEHRPGVTAVGNVRAGEGQVFGSNDQLTAVNPQIAAVIKLNWTHGSQARVRRARRQRRVHEQLYASNHHLSIGSPLAVTTPTGAHIPLVVKGTFKPPSGGSPFGTVTMSAATWDRYYQQPENLYTLVKMSGGETAANEAALNRALAPFPNAKVQTRQKFINNQISGLSSVLNILYVLLALSIIVSLFGIVNTLVLSVFERTREIGMLRAVGTTRRQIRRMIRHESVITALIGSVIGILLGIAFGALLAARDSSDRVHDPGRLADHLPDRVVDRRPAGGDLPRAPGGTPAAARGARLRVVRPLEQRSWPGIRPPSRLPRGVSCPSATAISWAIAASERDATSGSAIPSTWTSVRRPSPRSGPSSGTSAKIRSARTNFP